MKKDHKLNNEYNDESTPKHDEEGNILINLKHVPLDDIIRVVGARAKLVTAEMEDKEEFNMYVVLVTPEQRSRLVCKHEVDSTIVGVGEGPDSDIRILSHSTCHGMFFTDEDYYKKEKE